MKFGTFDWAGFLKELSELESKMYSEPYVRRLHFLREELLNDLSGVSPLCACGAVDAVIPDFKKSVRWFCKMKPRKRRLS